MWFRFIIAVFCVCLPVSVALQSTLRAQDKTPETRRDKNENPAGKITPRVLVLNSYHPQYRWTARLVEGVQREIGAVLPDESLHVEFMDGRRFVDDVEYENRLIGLLRHKYEGFKPTVIISSDDYAYNFLLRFGDEVFPGVPVVFCGVNVFFPEALEGKTNFTGILEGMDIAGNVELIMRLQPGTRRIIMLADRTTFGLKMTYRARQIEWARREKGHAVPTIEIWDSFTLAELYERMARVGPNTAILMLAIHKDRLGQYFSFARDLERLAEVSPVPIYGMWGALMIGHGVVGGMMNNPYEHGRAAAKIALRIVKGEKAKDIPIIPRAKFQPEFDYRRLLQYNIKLSLLPPGSRLHYRPRSFYDINKTLVHAALIVFFSLLLIILILVFNINSRRQAQRELRDLNARLEVRVKERTRELEIKNEELSISHRKLKWAQDNLRRDLDMSRKIQRQLLPITPPKIAGFSISSRYISMEEVGGDFIHYHLPDDGSFGFLIADAAGHGVPAALVGSMAKMVLENLPEDTCRKPSRLLASVNQSLLDKIYMNFVTACYALFEPSGRICYSLGGHPGPILMRSGAFPQFLEGKGSLLGVFPEPYLTEEVFEMAPGDRLLFITDGVLECRPADAAEDSLAKVDLPEILAGKEALSADELLEYVLEELRKYVGSQNFEDDLTMVLVDRK